MDQLIVRRKLRKRLRRGEAGMSMIEVLVAGFILTVGMLGFAALMTTAIASNSRSRADSTSIMLAQSMMDQIASDATISSTTSITDCSGTTTTANVAVGGALLDASEEIDWTQAPVTGYSMTYVICAATNNNTANAQQRSYDVRWHIGQVNTTDTDTYFIVVGARPSKWNNNLKQFTMPISLKSYIGPHSTTP